MYIFKSIWNVLKNFFCFLNELFIFIIAFIIATTGVMCLFYWISFFIGTIILNDGSIWNKLDLIFINIGFLEMIILPILFLVLNIHKEYKKLIYDNVL